MKIIVETIQEQNNCKCKREEREKAYFLLYTTQFPDIAIVSTIVGKREFHYLSSHVLHARNPAL
jgi:hypothetical protein